MQEEQEQQQQEEEEEGREKRVPPPALRTVHFLPEQGCSRANKSRPRLQRCSRSRLAGSHGGLCNTFCAFRGQRRSMIRSHDSGFWLATQEHRRDRPASGACSMKLQFRTSPRTVVSVLPPAVRMTLGRTNRRLEIGVRKNVSRLEEGCRE